MSVIFSFSLRNLPDILGYRYQSLLTVCNLEEVREGVHVLKVLKQKLFVDGVEYLLQEIYGLENKKTQPQVCVLIISLITVLCCLLANRSQDNSHQMLIAPMIIMMMMMTMRMRMMRIWVLSV